MVTEWTTKASDVSKALAAPITEMVFFTTTTSSLSIPDAKRAAEESMEWVMMASQKYGEAKGAAMGWSE